MSALVDHRLNRKNVSWLHGPEELIVLVVHNVGRAVEHSSHSVACVCVRMRIQEGRSLGKNKKAAYSTPASKILRDTGGAQSTGMHGVAHAQRTPRTAWRLGEEQRERETAIIACGRQATGRHIVLDDPPNGVVRNARFAYVDGCHPTVIRGLRLNRGGEGKGRGSKSEDDATRYAFSIVPPVPSTILGPCRSRHAPGSAPWQHRQLHRRKTSRCCLRGIRRCSTTRQC